MKITVITVCKNEEFLLPFFLRHYNTFVDEIHVFDNQSTDRSVEIISSNPKCILHQYDTQGVMNDRVHLSIKNDFYKLLKSDWFIVVDMDEFIYHPTIRGLLTAYMINGTTVPQVKGYGMVSEKVPIDDGKSQIYELVTEGMEYSNYDKKAIFTPQVNINYDAGCHRCRPSGRVIYSKDCVIKLLHFKMLSKEYVVEKAKKIVFSEINKQKKWGWECADPNVMAIDWERHWNNRGKVL